MILSGRRVLLAWIGWLVVTVLATMAMLRAQASFGQVHVVLVYLLIVLCASASGGRVLGLTLACAAALLIDYYFQPPYRFWGVGKPLDWIALFSFLVTSLVATQLLYRARAEAAEAQRRAVEVESLARLGSETLSSGRAEDALARIASVIQSTLGMTECTIDRAATADAPEWDVSPDGRVRRALIPLTVQRRVVGVLRLTSDPPVLLDPAQRRFLDALAYYAALAVDRVRLVAEAEHAEALREADRLKDVVLASVSHDLRTPLTTIKALAQSEALRGNESAGAIEEQADRLTRLVSDLLDLSRLKGGAFGVQPEINTAEDLIGAAVRQTQVLFGDGQLRTVIDLHSPALVGKFDFAQSLRILSNLLENAARHSRGQPVELGASRDGDMLVFTVSDRGPGIADDEAARIFEPFYRGRGATPDTGRAGLGLSIARTLAEMQGGIVSYARRPGGGSIFSLRLPASEFGAEVFEESV